MQPNKLKTLILLLGLICLSTTDVLSQGKPNIIHLPTVVPHSTGPVVTNLVNQQIEFYEGEYEIEISFLYNRNILTSDIYMLCMIDGVGIESSSDEIFRVETKDSQGTFGATGTNQKMDYNQSFIYNAPSTGLRTFTLSLAADTNDLASVWNVMVKFHYRG